MIGERLGDPDVNRKAPDLKPKKSTIAVHPLKLGVAEVTLHPRIPVLEIRFSTALRQGLRRITPLKTGKLR